MLFIPPVTIIKQIGHGKIYFYSRASTKKGKNIIVGREAHSFILVSDLFLFLAYSIYEGSEKLFAVC